MTLGCCLKAWDVAASLLFCDPHRVTSVSWPARIAGTCKWPKSSHLLFSYSSVTCNTTATFLPLQYSLYPYGIGSFTLPRLSNFYAAFDTALQWAGPWTLDVESSLVREMRKSDESEKGCNVVPAMWWTIYVDYTGLGVTVLHTLKQCHKAMQAAWNQNLFLSLEILHVGKGLGCRL